MTDLHCNAFATLTPDVKKKKKLVFVAVWLGGGGGGVGWGGAVRDLGCRPSLENQPEMGGGVF